MVIFSGCGCWPQIMNEYWDKEYPTHIEIPEGYWVCSYNVEWVNEN